MKFYDYEVVNLSFARLPNEFADVIRTTIVNKSNDGWRLVSTIADGHPTLSIKLLVFEKESTNLELKKVSHADVEENGHKKFLTDGWFFHSADSTGVNFVRKKPS
jgi:hypothetical protein